MDEFAQQLINGLSIGAIYALIALGYTMIYGVLRFINFAHGDVFMIGAYIGYYLLSSAFIESIGPGVMTALIVFLAAMIGCGLLGVLIEFLAYRPLRNRPKIVVLITAIGVSFFLEYTGQLPIAFGASPKTFPTIIEKSFVLQSGGLVIDNYQVIIFVVAIILMVGLRFLILKTRIGTAIRAASMNLNAASLMGINTNRVISTTFFIGSALAGAAAILYSMSYSKIDPLMGILPGMKAFIAAVLGGIGNIPGAAVGGFVIGMAETFTAGYISPELKNAIVFAILIVVLIIKPSGLFGTGGTEKV